MAYSQIYVMHGFCGDYTGIITHENTGFLEKNDSFFLIFGLPGAFYCFWFIIFQSIVLAIGLGITAYGLVIF